MLQILFMYLCVVAAPAYSQKSSIPQVDSTDSLTLYIFTGSDWCPNCRRFDKKVLHDSDFVKAMNGKAIRIEILDFPQRKKLSDETVAYNRAMSEKLGFKNVFPTIVLCSSTGNGKQRTFYYKNETGTEFGAMVLDELKHINE